MAVYYAVICFYADWMMELLPFLDWTVEALTDTVMTVTVRSPAPPLLTVVAVFIYYS